MRARHSLLRVLVSIGLLCGLGWWLDLGAAVSRLAEMRAEWCCWRSRSRCAGGCAGVALALHRRVPGCRPGVHGGVARILPLHLLNQVLPGGVVGDVSPRLETGARADAPAGTWRAGRAGRHLRAPVGSGGDDDDCRGLAPGATGHRQPWLTAGPGRGRRGGWADRRHDGCLGSPAVHGRVAVRGKCSRTWAPRTSPLRCLPRSL